MTHLSTLELHRFRLGELPAERVTEIETHLDSCTRCATRAGIQQQQAVAVAAAPLPALLAADIRPANRPWRGAFASVTAVAAAVFLVVGLSGPLVHPEVSPTTRSKGVLPTVELWVGGEAGVHPLRSHQKLSAGDKVQVLYDTEGASFAVLAGRDGTQRIEIYGELPPHSELFPAPFALTLDDAPGPQEFFVVSANHPLSHAEVEAAIRHGVGDINVRVIAVEKE